MSATEDGRLQFKQNASTVFSLTRMGGFFVSELLFRIVNFHFKLFHFKLFHVEAIKPEARKFAVILSRVKDYKE